MRPILARAPSLWGVFTSAAVLVASYNIAAAHFRLVQVDRAAALGSGGTLEHGVPLRRSAAADTTAPPSTVRNSSALLGAAAVGGGERMAAVRTGGAPAVVAPGANNGPIVKAKEVGVTAREALLAAAAARRKNRNKTAAAIANGPAAAAMAAPPPLFGRNATRDVTTAKRLYACGWDNGRLPQLLFPDYVYMGRLNDNPHPLLAPSNGSIVVIGENGPCNGAWMRELTKDARGGRNGVDKLTNVTPGLRVLYVNGESRTMFRGAGNVPAAHSSSRGVSSPPPPPPRGYFGPASLIGLHSPPEWDAILRPERKPVNTGERFLMYLVSRCVEHRDGAFDKLSEVGRSPAHHGGACRGLDGGARNNAVAAPPGEVSARDGPKAVDVVPWRDNSRIFRRYRFCLVMEHPEKPKPGYITEKIINAFLGGCVPIYHGTTEVFDIFNRRAFVYYDPSRFKSGMALERVAYLERNSTAYEEVLREPILAEGNLTVREHFSYTDEVGGGVLKGRIREMLGVPA